MSAFWESFRKIPRYWIILAVAIVIAGLITWAAYLRFFEDRGWAEWTGYGEQRIETISTQVTLNALGTPEAVVTTRNIEIRPGKTLWDWQVVLLGILGAIFIAYLNNLNQKKRIKTEHEISTDRQREEALQSYLDNMAMLLLKEKLIDKKNDEHDPTVYIAQIRTITILRLLDTKRKNIVFQFLRDSNLADFLLISASFMEADLQHTFMHRIVFKSSNLGQANMSGADLFTANLSRATLSGANLAGANLTAADLIEVLMDEADLRQAKLFAANLSRASLNKAKLGGTDMGFADLSEADLSEVDLSEANLNGAQVTDEQLANAKSLKGANMPNFAKYDGRYNLSGDIERAKEEGIDVNDPLLMAEYYSVTLEAYQSGQEWARENLSKLRGESSARRGRRGR